MADYDLAGFEIWLDKHRLVIEGLNVYRSLRQGFSFRIFESNDAGEVAPHFAKYQWSISDMQRFWPHCLAKGYEYCRVITDRQINQRDKIRLIEMSEEHGHVFHNTAVLYLESLSEDRDAAVSAYENSLKQLWLGEVRAFNSGEFERREALTDYLRDHTVLGKIIRSRTTQFHDRPTLLRMHPAFWGLFLFSRTHRADNVRFPIKKGSAEAKWRQKLADWNRPNADKADHYVTKFLNSIEPPARYPIYEPLPRHFTDRQAAPRGVYLHRSKAHGRDEFLVVNTPDSERAVFCTKGVGADLDQVMPTIKSRWPDSALARYWESGPTGRKAESSPLPFEYRFILRATGWSVLGFCIDVGNMGEHLGQDYYNFAAMYDFVDRWRTAAVARGTAHALARTIVDWLPQVFVEPYACVEISRHYLDRLRKPIGRKDMLLAKTGDRFKPVKPQKKEDAFLGMPVQMVTGAPCETSLRLETRDKAGAPAYNYECPPLELKEWARCVGGIQTDIRNAVKTDAGDQEKEVMDRLAVAYQLAAILTASFIAFQKKGWLTGKANPSFAPRNFGSGPRDSPDWMPLAKATEKATLQSIELSNLRDSLRDFIGHALSVHPHWEKLVSNTPDNHSFPRRLYALLPHATGKPDLLQQMKDNAEKNPPDRVKNPTEYLANEFVKALIDLNCEP